MSWATDLRKIPVALIGFIWVLSDLGYYFLLPRLGITGGYTDNSMPIALYYFYWVGLCVVIFTPLYSTWQEHSRWGAFENPILSAAVWTVFFVSTVLFVGYVIPALPPFVPPPGVHPPELPFADPWYFLPKSVDILFQQLLVAALVLSLASFGYSFRRISITCAALFGASHLLLLFGGAPFGYVLIFSLVASVFGLVFPYLMLRVRNGLAYSYFAHWSFYAAVVMIARMSDVMLVSELVHGS